MRVSVMHPQSLGLLLSQVAILEQNPSLSGKNGFTQKHRIYRLIISSMTDIHAHRQHTSTTV